MKNYERNTRAEARWSLVIIAVLVVLCTIMMTGKHKTSPAVSFKEAIAEQLEMYPESRVQDIYKSFCQDAFGPGHLIPDRDAARRYLHSELSEYMAELDSGICKKPEIILVPAGLGQHFYRVDLSVILDGILSEEEYLDAFVSSANSVTPPSDAEWASTWNMLKETILEDFPGIPDARKDIAYLDSLVAVGQFIIHHSDAFSNAFHPHYRIIAKDQLEKLSGSRKPI